MKNAGASVRFENVIARYPGTRRAAVDGVTLTVPAGSLVVLLGPSGCGKSTLLRTVNRLIAPDGGRVLLDGRDVASLPATALRRGIGYAIQAVGLFPHYTVGENIGIVPGLLGCTRERIRTRVDELLALVRLDPSSFRDRLPRELSGGEQQRVGVARAIAADPPLLLMDEPFGAVDAIVRGALQDEIRRIHRRLGATILFVTHDVDEALALADVLVVMRDGRIEQHGSPLALLVTPATDYVRELLDTQDVIRRLSFLHVADAIRTRVASPSTTREIAPESAPVRSEATLREALVRLLAADGADAPVLPVERDGRIVDTLRFADIHRLLVQAVPPGTPAS